MTGPEPAPPQRITPPRRGQLRVALFTDDFYPDSGGVCRSIELQVTELVRRGVHVTLFTPGVNFTPPAVGDYVTLPVVRLPHTPSFLCSLRFEAPLARRIAGEFRFDVVHSQNERGAMLLAARVARLQGAAHVHTFHSNYAGTHATAPTASGFSSALFLPSIPALLRAASGRTPSARARRQHDEARETTAWAPWDWRNLARIAALTDAFTSPAQFVVDSIVRASDGALADRAAVVPSGVADAFVAVRRRRPYAPPVRFLSIGRLGAEKRVDHIVRAFASLGVGDSELIVAGSGPQEVELKRLAGSLVRHGRVRFVGHIRDVGQVAQTIADSDVFVLASYGFDTQGMVLAEAAASGTAILYCDDRLSVGVTERNALLTGPTTAALAAGMRRLQADHAGRRAMGEASAALTPQLTVAAMGENYLAAYDRARRLRAG